MVLQQPDDDLGDPWLVQGKGWGHSQLKGREKVAKVSMSESENLLRKFSFSLAGIRIGRRVHRGCSHKEDR